MKSHVYVTYKCNDCNTIFKKRFFPKGKDHTYSIPDSIECPTCESMNTSIIKQKSFTEKI